MEKLADPDVSAGHVTRFERASADRIVRSQGGPVAATGADAAKQRLKDAEKALQRLQNAILAGVDPAAVRDAINTAQVQKEAARAELATAPGAVALTDADDGTRGTGSALRIKDQDKLYRLIKIWREESPSSLLADSQ